jgi:hypothetical protein
MTDEFRYSLDDEEIKEPSDQNGFSNAPTRASELDDSLINSGMTNINHRVSANI